MQLAVVAHIRHTYTDYDKLLKRGDWHAARSQVEQMTLDKLLTWRRDDDDDPNAMDGILREVIVIPDDDEENEIHDINVTGAAQADREDSVEIVSNHAAEDELQTKPIEYGTMDFHADPNRAHSPEIHTREPIRYVRRERLPYPQKIQGGKERLDRIGDYRYRVWEQALHRRRRDPEPLYSMDHHPGSPEAAKSNQINLLQNHAEPRKHWFEGAPRQPHLVKYVGKAPVREQLHYGALPSDEKHVEIRSMTDHNRELSREIGYAPGQVSQIHPQYMVTRTAFAQMTCSDPPFISLRIDRYTIRCSHQQVLIVSEQAVPSISSMVEYPNRILYHIPAVNKGSQGHRIQRKPKDW